MVLKKYWQILLLLLISLSLTWPLWQAGYFSHHDNLQTMRILEMRKCFSDWQIPCRWVPDMGYGNGFPLFNFYSVLPYYIGGLISYVTSYIIAAKILFFIPLVMGGIFMYLFLKEFFPELPAFVGATIFTLAPYKALDIYVRGAIAESFAITLAPLIFYFSYRLIKSSTKSNFLGFSLSLAGFLMCHNIMTLFFFPLVLLWILLILFYERKNTFVIALALALGVGLASFFLFPAFLEKGLVQTDTLVRGDLDFRAHFVSIRQLFFDYTWGYGASIPGDQDTISFQVGFVQWIFTTIGLLLVFFSFIKQKKLHITPRLGLPLFWGIVFIFSVFMTHDRSAFIWERISLLHFAQFPWRFLSISIIAGSIMTSFVISELPKKWQLYGSIGVVLVTLFLNWRFFRPEKFFPNYTDQLIFSQDLWEEQQKAGILDYLPKTAREPKEPAPSQPIIVSGIADVTSFHKGSDNFSMQINVKTPSVVEMPIFDFPNWQVSVNNKDTKVNHDNYLGRVEYALDQGEYTVNGVLQNTLVRTAANIITMLSVILLLFVIILDKRWRIFK
jgi:hypothetical protein